MADISSSLPVVTLTIMWLSVNKLTINILNFPMNW